MQKMNSYRMRQGGITLFGLIFALVVIGLIAVLAMKVAPTYIEYRGIVKAVVSAKSTAHSVRDIQMAFDRQADVGYIEAIKGRDLNIVRNGEDFDISFEYEKRINLIGPVSLVIEYSNSTSKTHAQK